MEKEIKKVKERDTADLLELVCQLHSRALSQPNNKLMHDNYVEARTELDFRIASLQPVENAVSKPIWYTQSEMYDWFIKNKYSKEIADELSKIWAVDLQNSFEKGYDKAQRELLKTPMSSPTPDSLPKAPAQEAVGFAEWMLSKDVEKWSDDKWSLTTYLNISMTNFDRVYYTTQELYSLYLKEETKEVQEAWVSVEERLPEAAGNYIGYNNERGVFPAKYNKGFKQFYVAEKPNDFFIEETPVKLISWMSLPKPPKQK